jgi:hypothetical protein
MRLQNSIKDRLEIVAGVKLESVRVDTRDYLVFFSKDSEKAFVTNLDGEIIVVHNNVQCETLKYSHRTSLIYLIINSDTCKVLDIGLDYIGKVLLGFKTINEKHLMLSGETGWYLKRRDIRLETEEEYQSITYFIHSNNSFRFAVKIKFKESYRLLDEEYTYLTRDYNTVVQTIWGYTYNCSRLVDGNEKWFEVNGFTGEEIKEISMCLDTTQIIKGVGSRGCKDCGID